MKIFYILMLVYQDSLHQMLIISASPSHPQNLLKPPSPPQFKTILKHKKKIVKHITSRVKLLSCTSF